MNYPSLIIRDSLFRFSYLLHLLKKFCPQFGQSILYMMNHSISHRFRQYGLWERYDDLYKDGDLVYTVGTNSYEKDWFYAHVNRWAIFF